MISSNESEVLLKHPAGLEHGDTIGVVAPASHFDRRKYERGLHIIESMGYRVKIPTGVFNKKRYLAGTDKHRALLLNDLFADEGVKAIFCIRGGFGSMRILPHLALDQISLNAKIIVGFSDISALLNVLYQRCGLLSFHGPNVNTFEDTPVEILDVFWQMLALGHCPTMQLSEGCAIRGGKATGLLMGGNLTTLCHLVGTPYQLNFKGHLLFLEDRGERPYRIDRMLTQMKMAGSFTGIKGVLMGAFTDCGDLEMINEIVAETFEEYGIPILSGFEIGHIRKNQVIPIGLRATLNADKQTLEFHGPLLQP
jgi:muramoyltetrapeptide carboxypeptidase